MSNQFTEQEWLRYTRHIQLAGFGAAGQLRLKQSHVLIVGLGGLGTPVSMYLTAAGVGSLTLIDGDHVDLTNLQRQVIYTMDDIGKPKAQISATRLSSLNPDISISAFSEHFSTNTKFDNTFDLVVDCTDNFTARYAINDFCLKHETPWIYASVHQNAGQCAVFTPGEACFRCLFPKAPDTAADCNSVGVIGVLPGMLGLFQANEAIHYLTRDTSALSNTLMLFNAQNLDIQKIQLSKDPSCMCSHPGEELLLPSSESVTHCEVEASPLEISKKEFIEYQKNCNAQIVDVRTEEERQAFNIGGEHFPLDMLERAEYISEKLDKTKTLVFYCQSGTRSLQAAHAMHEQGFNSVSLSGGILAWLREEYST